MQFVHSFSNTDLKKHEMEKKLAMAANNQHEENSMKANFTCKQWIFQQNQRLKKIK